MFKRIFLPPVPLTSEDSASPERGGEDRTEQELREELELCHRQVREGRRGGSSLTSRCSWEVEKNIWSLRQVCVDIAGMLAMPIGRGECLIITFTSALVT